MQVQDHNEPKQTSRIEAFSDGVFAIAITLLVLEIHVPELSGEEALLPAMLHNWTSYLGFLIGFLTILICWFNHHHMFELINKSNGMLLLLNGFKLLVISFTPFATALLSKYINTPQQHVAVEVYAFNYALMGMAMFLIWNYASKKGLTKQDDGVEAKATTQLYTLAACISATIFLVSFFSTVGALVVSGIMFAVFLFPKNTSSFLVQRIEKKGAVKLVKE